MRSNKHEYYGKAGRWQCINCPMENVKSWHQSGRRVGSTQNWEQMTMPFWEPIPYTVWLMHCKKLRAPTPTGNPLKTINSEYVLCSTKEKKNGKAFLYFYALAHVPAILPFFSSLCLSPACTRVCTGARSQAHTFLLAFFLSTLCIFSCFPYISSFTSACPVFKSTALIAKPSSR